MTMATPIDSQILNGFKSAVSDIKHKFQSLRKFIYKSKIAVNKIPQRFIQGIPGSKSKDKTSKTLPVETEVSIQRSKAPSNLTIILPTELPCVDDLTCEKNAAIKRKSVFETTLEDIPTDILDDIILQTSAISSINLGQTSEYFHKLTKSKLANLQAVRKFCGNRMYFKLARDTRYLFSPVYSDDDPYFLNERRSMDRSDVHHECIKALFLTSELVKKRLNSFTIWLSHKEINDAFFHDLGKFLSIKPFELITVMVHRYLDSSIPLSKDIEKKLLDTFASTEIQKIDFKIPLSSPRNINSKMVKEVCLLPYSEDSDSLGRLNNLKSIVIKGHQMLTRESNWDSFYATICGKRISCSIECVSHTSHLISDSINRFPALKSISIIDSKVWGQAPFVNSLISLIEPPTEFSFISGFPVNMTELFPLLDKWKTKLKSLSFLIYTDQMNSWVAILNFLFAQSQCLTELSIIGELDSQNFSKVFEFIENHKTLARLTIHMVYRFFSTENEFIEFFKKLVSSILQNSKKKLQLKNINLISVVDVEDYQRFLRTISNVTAPLIRRGIILNGLPVERIVIDL